VLLGSRNPMKPSLLAGITLASQADSQTVGSTTG
jgi:hypothetical protein